MTQEEKQLLLKDICARLPYKVYVNYDGGKDKQYEGILDDILPSRGEAYVEYCLCGIDDIRPYLRPMSSMTDEERSELLEHGFDADCEGYIKNGWMYSDAEKCNFEINIDDIMWLICWLNEHHFDYRGLIEKGLALEAPEGMYEI